MARGLSWTEEELAAYNARTLHQTLREATRDSESDEKTFLAHVIRVAKAHAWLCYHTHDSRKSEEGFPDLVLVRDAAIIFAELKSRTGKLTMAQGTWLEMLRRTGKVEVYLWRPGDWPCIEERLTRKERYVNSR